MCFFLRWIIASNFTIERKVIIIFFYYAVPEGSAEPTAPFGSNWFVIRKLYIFVQRQSSICKYIRHNKDKVLRPTNQYQRFGLHIQQNQL